MRDIIWILLLIIIAAIIPVIVIIGPQLDLSLLLPQPEQPEEPAPAISPDAQRYFELKNISCSVLSKDFLIATDDVAKGMMKGLIPATEDEPMIAQMIVSGYGFNQTTRTYLRGDQMKKTIISNGTETTTIWKNGRIYECTENCTMKLMDKNESEEYYDELYKMRNNCAFFGKTELPESVDTSLLLDIQKTGVMEINGYRCENFLITGNRTYAQSINETDEDQAALLWFLSNLDGPAQECLDESTGIIVLRNITLDLTGFYNFEFEKDGYFKVNQVTMLTYFADSVPESFLALPD